MNNLTNKFCIPLYLLLLYLRCLLSWLYIAWKPKYLGFLETQIMPNQNIFQNIFLSDLSLLIENCCKSLGVRISETQNFSTVFFYIGFIQINQQLVQNIWVSEFQKPKNFVPIFSCLKPEYFASMYCDKLKLHMSVMFGEFAYFNSLSYFRKIYSILSNN